MLCKRGEIAPKEQSFLFPTIFCYLLLDFHVKKGTKVSLRDKRLFEISEFEITSFDCIILQNYKGRYQVMPKSRSTALPRHQKKERWGTNKNTNVTYEASDDKQRRTAVEELSWNGHKET